MEVETRPIVRAVGLGKQVSSPEGELTILDGIDLAIGRGERVAILGASGSGKSTLLGLLAGLDLPSHGRVELDGTDLATLDEDGRARLRAGHVGFVFQSFQLLPGLSALENVMLPLELAGRADAAALARETLEHVGLTARARHYPAQLSGGEQQRVAIARAFAPRPALLFADEPTGNLDRRTGQTVIDLLFRLNAEQGTTLVLVTHDVHLAGYCERRLVMEAGRLAEEAA
ncbi:ABC transporter ATP-binding protein [Plasticicumulans acidivorans]|uniref:Putative ABC transport system ATP-binding protein n=1 Tax=Plasticicumulans acidivorans TaxID=886464 RepID=A0A317MW42_9GAMM|nr:ATP-binding cassette domain-containing protein [Plasticicumulans acidivorans]PWV61689.1 putative ABC transport system ATP-binding protein [Plasticicumulans acidivorans]